MDFCITEYHATLPPSLHAVVAAAAREASPVVLEGWTERFGPHTVVAFDPAEVLTCAPGGGDPFEALRDRLQAVVPGGFAIRRDRGGGEWLGWIGYFAYEAGRSIEKLPATTLADVGLPLARWSLYDSAAVYFPARQQWLMVLADHERAVTPLTRRRARLESLLRSAVSRAPIGGMDLPPAQDNMNRAEYLHMVARGREYIAAGDIFQVNLARRESFEQREAPWRTYLRLREVNPAGYGAYLSWVQNGQPLAILSASPELFLRLDGREVVSRPIKGTRPRLTDPGQDAAIRMELGRSAKDRAELAMIVDLVRNDLGRVCEYGTVRVRASEDGDADPYELETHPTVHHLVATIAGRLADGRDAIDLVRACFPGGSITGAPKVRAMEIIDELEPTERSVYTGSIGCFGLDGSMTLNIAIRTMIVAAGRIHLYAGGGIVADSVPEDEFRETCAKALGMRRALGAQAGQTGGE